MINLNNVLGLYDRKSDFGERYTCLNILFDIYSSTVRDTISAHGWVILPHPLSSPDMAPSDNQVVFIDVFRAFHGIIQQLRTSRKGLLDWTILKDILWF
ncbi:hypothetical protein CDAR_269111 [Caerostris darwini]|uniref:Uncharacterized protein n=1 Tax=Caerostris darwini TaxID=1538125 RepID=A0AAV4VKA3_9ARAC|nr:hypothetical protein CDAR_269111 [Caerostris darwini]